MYRDYFGSGVQTNQLSEARWINSIDNKHGLLLFRFCVVKTSILRATWRAFCSIELKIQEKNTWAFFITVLPWIPTNTKISLLTLKKSTEKYIGFIWFLVSTIINSLRQAKSIWLTIDTVFCCSVLLCGKDEQASCDTWRARAHLFQQGCKWKKRCWNRKPKFVSTCPTYRNQLKNA